MKHVDEEYCLPFDNNNPEFWMRIEHLGRYLYAADFARKKRPEKALDAACADGYGTLEIADFCGEITGLDYNTGLIESAKANADTEGISNARFVLSDLNEDSLDWLSGIDLVTCFDTLEHLKEPQLFLSKLNAVMNRNAVLLLSVPKAEYEPADKDGVPTNEFHLHRFEEDELSVKLEKAGFNIQRTLYQPYTNMCMSLEKNVVRDTDVTIEQARSYFSHSKDALRFFARMFAYPDPSLKKFSYSLFIRAGRR